jgi:hypothetical protein
MLLAFYFFLTMPHAQEDAALVEGADPVSGGRSSRSTSRRCSRANRRIVEGVRLSGLKG